MCSVHDTALGTLALIANPSQLTHLDFLLANTIFTQSIVANDIWPVALKSMTV